MAVKVVITYDENTQSVGVQADRPVNGSLMIAILSTVITDLARKMTAMVQQQPTMTRENIALVKKLQNS